MNGEHTFRFTILGLFLSMLPLMILVQMVLIQTNPAEVDAFLQQSDIYSKEWKILQPARGQIYDRWGHLLAGNEMTYVVAVDIPTVEDPHTIALTASVVLGVKYEEALAAASKKPSDSLYQVLAKNVTEAQVKQLAQLKDQAEAAYGGAKGQPSLEGLVFEPMLSRTYPEKSLASNILGFVNREGKGYFGVEEEFNELLAGKPKTVEVPRDPNKVTEKPVVPDGASLVLTIDREIQDAMEKLLDRSVAETGSDSGTIVVIEPRTGELIALATTPRMDLNEFWRYSDVFPKDTPFNRAVSQAYEPGSVFKVLTMAAGLDSGAVKPETSFLDTGVFEIGGTYIYNWNGGAWGPQDMTGCMQHSLNVCLAWIATQTGAKDFYRYMQGFGIGHLTGIELAGENPGRLKIPGDGDWYEADLGTNSFGQGVSATPIQMAASIASLANDGKMMAPHIVRSIINKGYQHDMEQRVMGVTVKPETAQTLTEMLARSLETESSDALVPGYRIAGKTGTAEIPTPLGYTSNETNASFVGWGPADDPQFLVYVWLERPSTSVWGSVVAAPVFSEAVKELVVLLNLPPDDVRLRLNGQ